MKRLWLQGSLVCGSLLLHACGGGSAPPPPPAAQLKVTSSSAATAGTALQVSVSAVGTNGAVASTYTGTVHFTSSDPQAVLPKDSILTNGAGTFPVALKTAGNQSISVADTVTVSIAGSNSISVSPGPAAQFTVSGPPAATTDFVINVSVSAQDAYSNTATGYTGTVKFSSSDTQATLPANSPLSGGVGNFSVTFKTVGSQTVSATDTVTASLKGGSSAINVVSNAVTHLSFNGIPGSAATRQSFNFTVNALDAANNVAAGYSGTVQFSSSDSTAKLPPHTALAAGVSGSLSATFESAGSGSQTLAATDTVTDTLAVSATITVTAAAALNISSGAPPSGTVGDLYYPHTIRVCRGYPICTPVQVTVHGFPLTATGGIPPYNWNWTAASGSSLPPGLAIYTQGSIACGALFAPRPPCIGGTPTEPGTFNVALTLTDSGVPAVQSSASYPITIAKPAVPSVNSGLSPTPAVENQPYSFAFSASGYPPLTWSESGALPTGLTFNAANGTLSGAPTQTGSFPISITATDQFGQSSQPANFTLVVSAHGFVADGNMTSARTLHTSTLLHGGMVLIAGGASFGAASTVLASAELYNPNAGTFSATGNLQTPRAWHTATLLNDGRVLVAGGCSVALAGPLASVELFDSSGATSTATASMNTARCGHTATLLANGKVLVTGGTDPTGTALASAELFDPTTDTFSSTGSMQTARKEHTATLLASGKVLVTGGVDAKSNDLDSAELYDPTAGTFTTLVGVMTAARAGHTATILTSGADVGKVLLAGGTDATGKAQNAAELFDPAAQSFTATSNMTTAHAYYTATLLLDGTVLLAGGVDATGSSTSVAELFEPSSGNFSATGSLILAREQHAATPLANGQVLVTGGSNAVSIASAELYK
jgi:Putative Ig domain/Galactose oxidase, central domain